MGRGGKTRAIWLAITILLGPLQVLQYILLCKQNVKNHHHLIEEGELMHFLSNKKARTFY